MALHEPMNDSGNTPAPVPASVVSDRRRIPSKLVRTGLGTVLHFFADRCPTQAAAISYRVLFSIAPLGIVLVSIFGLVLQDDSFRQDVVNAVVARLPVSATGQVDVEDAIGAIATPASAAGLLSLMLFAWAATGVMTAIRQGLECAMSVHESRPMARGKLVDLVLVVGAAALVLVTVVVTVLGDVVQESSGPLAERLGLAPGALADGLLRGASFAISAVVVLLLYRFVPARGLRIRDGILGALATAVLLQLISLASGWIYDKSTRLTVLYGSLTTALVFLYSMYLCACALLLGAELAAEWSRPPTVGEPATVQLRRAALGVFVRQKPPPTKFALPDLLGDDAAPDP
jgi:membrane protein